MAAGTKCFMRLQTMPNVACDPDEFYQRYLKKTDYANKQRIVMKYTGTASNGYTQVSIPNAVFDGTTTPIIVYVISASDTDKDAADGHARKVTIIGLTANGLETEVIPITTAGGTTQAAGTTLWKRIFHAYVSAWGSGGNDAAGNITITNTGQTATYLTIAAGSNESDGMAFWVDSGMIVHNSYHHHVLTTTTQVNRKVRVKYVLTGFGRGTDPDFSPMEYTAAQESSARECHNCGPKAPGNDAKIDPYETYVGGAEDFDMLAHFWVYS